MADVDSLDDLQQRITAALPAPATLDRGIDKVRYSHDAMINLIIANPMISQNQLAFHFGYSVGWVSQIIASDAFKARLHERTTELVDPLIVASVKERFEGLITRSLEILQEKLSKPSHQVPDQLVLRALEVSARANGYGAKETQPAVKVDMNIHLEDLGGRLTKLMQSKRLELPVIEGDEG